MKSNYVPVLIVEGLSGLASALFLQNITLSTYLLKGIRLLPFIRKQGLTLRTMELFRGLIGKRIKLKH